MGKGWLRRGETIRQRFLVLMVFIVLSLQLFTIVEDEGSDALDPPDYVGATTRASGNGTADDPYVITTAAELQNISLGLSAHYRLGNDIDASATKGWNGGLGFDPIGDPSTPFTGSLDGAGFEISDLNINRQEDYVGLFARMSGAWVKDLNITDIVFKGNRFSGSVCGYAANSRVEDCIVTGDVVSQYSYCIGGLIGYFEGSGSTIANSSSRVSMTITYYTERCGGLVGYNYYGTIFNSTFTGRIDVSIDYGGNNIGGLVGFNGWGTIERGTSRGPMTLSNKASAGYVGGLVGLNTGSVKASSCLEVGSGKDNVLEISDAYSVNSIGGLIGYDVGTSSDCQARIDVQIKMNNPSYPYQHILNNVGGLVGKARTQSPMDRCSWVGSIDITTTVTNLNVQYCGGLAGWNEHVLDRCWSSGIVFINWNAYDVGGLVGRNTGPVRESRSSVFTEVRYRTDANNIGCLIGFNSGAALEDSSSSGDIKLFASSGTPSASYVGDLVGRNGGDVRRCWSSGNITVQGASRITSFGGLIGFQEYGSISECHSLGGVSIDSSQSVDNVGGLVGNNVGSIADAYATKGTLTVSGTCDSSAVGGLVGMNRGSLSGCTSTNAITMGEITPKSGGLRNIGGLVGDNDLDVTNCYSKVAIGFNLKGVSISTNKLNAVGGLIGYNYASGVVRDCHSEASIKPTTGPMVYAITNVGGLIGYNKGSIETSFSTGTLALDDSEDASMTGGLAGTNAGTVLNCYSIMTFNFVQVVSAVNIGGLVGDNSNEITNAYAVATKKGASAVEMGGFAGSNTKTITDSFYENDVFLDKGVITGSSEGLTGQSSILMKQRAKFVEANWDFYAKWGIIEDTSYPFLLGIYTYPSIDAPAVTDPLEDSLFLVDYTVAVSKYPSMNDIGSVDLLTDADWLVHDRARTTISGTPDNEDVGPVWFNLSLVDLVGNMAYLNISLTVVNSNDPPEIVTEDITEVLEDEPYSRYYYAVDVDPYMTRLNWSMSTDAKWLFFEGNHLHGTPLAYDLGEYWVNVSVSDNEGGIDFTNFTVAVLSANDRPVITTEPVTLAYEDQEYRMDLKATDVDEGDKLTWTLVSGPTWLKSARTFVYGTPGNDDVGLTWVYLKVVDSMGESDELAFVLEVKDVNDPPLWTDVPDDVEIDENETFFTFVAAKDIDVGDEVSYNISSLPVTNMTVDGSSGIVRWDRAVRGVFAITVFADDGESRSFAVFNITVKEVPFIPPVIEENHAPVLGRIEEVTVGAGGTMDLQLSATDEDGDDLLFTLLDGPGTMVLSIDGRLLWRPNATETGNYSVEVMVTDGELNDTARFNVSVVHSPSDGTDGGGTSDGGSKTSFIAPMIALAILCIILLAALILVAASRRSSAAADQVQVTKADTEN